MTADFVKKAGEAARALPPEFIIPTAHLLRAHHAFKALLVALNATRKLQIQSILLPLIKVVRCTGSGSQYVNFAAVFGGHAQARPEQYTCYHT